MYQREIIYLGLYQNGEKVNSAGFGKFEIYDKKAKMNLQLRNIPEYIEGKFEVELYEKEKQISIGSIIIAGGTGTSILSWNISDMDHIEENISEKKVIGKGVHLRISLPKGCLVEGKKAEEPLQKSSKTKEWKAAEHRQEEPIQEEPLREELRSGDPRKEEPKWEQLLNTYDKIHPYGDERVYVKLEPKDFVVLQEKYQHLANNSFLLHGFYNYRYIILGKEDGYFLGVPGVFYEREKMMALMFGFEAFECEGGIAKVGGFGYYLRRVEL